MNEKTLILIKVGLLCLSVAGVAIGVVTDTEFLVGMFTIIAAALFFMIILDVPVGRSPR